MCIFWCFTQSIAALLQEWHLFIATPHVPLTRGPHRDLKAVVSNSTLHQVRKVNGELHLLFCKEATHVAFILMKKLAILLEIQSTCGKMSKTARRDPFFLLPFFTCYFLRLFPSGLIKVLSHVLYIDRTLTRGEDLHLSSSSSSNRTNPKRALCLFGEGIKGRG